MWKKPWENAEKESRITLAFCTIIRIFASLFPHKYAEPDAESLDMLRMAMERLQLSARAYGRILKVARTIADLDGSERVLMPHIAEALGYRNLDRGDWAERGI